MYLNLTSAEGSSIREIVVDTVFSHRKVLILKRPFQELIREAGDFAIDLVLKMTNSDTTKFDFIQLLFLSSQVPAAIAPQQSLHPSNRGTQPLFSIGCSQNQCYRT